MGGMFANPITCNDPMSTPASMVVVDAEEIYPEGLLKLLIKEDLLKPSLAIDPIVTVRLAGELLAVEAERMLLASSQVFIEVHVSGVRSRGMAMRRAGKSIPAGRTNTPDACRWTEPHRWQEKTGIVPVSPGDGGSARRDVAGRPATDPRRRPIELVCPPAA